MGTTPSRPSKASSLWKIALGLLAVLWATLVLLAYLYTHKPVQPGQAAALGGLALALAAWLGTLATAHWLGGMVGWFIPRMSLGVRLPLRIGVGLGALGLLVLILGMLGAYYPLVIWALWIPGVVMGLRGLLRDVRRIRPRLPANGFERFLAAVLALFVVTAFLRALAPPTAWDALVYHLTGPKLYIQAHGLIHDLDLPYLGFPAWGSMLFTWGMLLAGPAVAKLLHFTFMLLTLCLTANMAVSFAPDRGWLSAAVLAAVPSLALIGGWAYVEWMTMFAAAGAFWCLFHRFLNADEDNPGESDAVKSPSGGPSLSRGVIGSGEGGAILAGLLAGLGFSAKYTLVGMVVGMACVAFLRRRSWKDLVAFGAAFSLVTAPYLIKNWALTGNPVYPFFLSGVYWDAHRQFWYSRPGTGLSPGQILLAPWEATVWGAEGGSYEAHPSYGASIGPLLLMLLPLAALFVHRARGRARRVLIWMILVCAVVYIQWALMLAFSSLLIQTRLLFVIFPFLALLAALGLDGLRDYTGPSFRADFVLRALIVLSLALGAVQGVLSFVSRSPLPVVLGLQSHEDYLLARLGGYYLAMRGVDDLADGSRVTFLWEPRSYYCRGEVICEPDALLDRWWHLRQHGLTPKAIADEWRRSGTTFVLINWSGAEAVREAGFDPFTSADWAALEQLVDGQLVEVGEWAGSYSLYALR